MKVFSIPLRLPSLNEYQYACRRHPLNGSRMKKNSMASVCTYLNSEPCKEFPIQVEIYYVEPNKRRDIDNITGYGNKVILDALQHAGIIPDDGPRFVNKIESSVKYEQGTENIIVVLQERGDPDWLDLEDINDVFAYASKRLPAAEKPKEPEVVPRKRRQTKERTKNQPQTLTLDL